MILNGRLYPPAESDYTEASKKFDKRLKSPQGLELPKPLDDAMLRMSILFSPIDSRTFEPFDIDDFKKVRHALATGAILGHHLNLYAYQPMVILSDEITRNIFKHETKKEDDDDVPATQRLVNASLEVVKQMGDDAYDWITSYEERTIGDAKMQPYVKVGCGVVTLAVRRSFNEAIEHNKKDLELFKQELATSESINWDAIDWSGLGQGN